ncbi:MAG TPA: hypothetical protein VFI95_03490 [Terriglobales bacterium]|nr:hypothetical protein [Terriglobales bacterium]
MGNAPSRAAASLGWKLTIFVPLAAAIALQWLSQRQADIRASVRWSVAAGIFLSVSLIAQSVHLLRTARTWGIVLLIVSSAVLGFGVHVLLRAL